MTNSYNCNNAHITHRSALVKLAYGEDEPWYSRVSRKAWGGIGGFAGALKGLGDKVSGNSQGSWGDYIRTGYNVAHDNADRLVASAVEGAANVLPIPSEWVYNLSNGIYDLDSTGLRELDDNEMYAMRRGGNYAGGIPALAYGTIPLFSKIFPMIQKPITHVGRAGWKLFTNGRNLTERAIGAAASGSSVGLTSKLYGLDSPYVVIDSVKDGAKDIWDWTKAARGKLYQ